MGDLNYRIRGNYSAVLKLLEMNMIEVILLLIIQYIQILIRLLSGYVT